MEKLLKALELVKQQAAMTLTNNNCSLFGSIISLLEDGIQELSMPPRLVLSETDRQHLKDKIDSDLTTRTYKDSIIIPGTRKRELAQKILACIKATEEELEGMQVLSQIALQASLLDTTVETIKTLCEEATQHHE